MVIRVLLCLTGALLLFADLGQLVLFMSGKLSFVDVSRDSLMGGLTGYYYFLVTVVFAGIGFALLCIGFSSETKKAEKNTAEPKSHSPLAGGI